jgi:Zn-dependent protease
MTVKEEMQRQFGPQSLERAIKAGELYDAVDALTAAIKSLAARVEALEIGGIKYLGTWQRALSYRKGTVATSGGSLWIALRDTVEGEQPGKALDAWQLAAKAARPVVRAKANGRQI